MPFPFSVERIAFAPSIRRDAPGSFVETSAGFTHYQFAGPAGGDCVVLVCGFAMPLAVFDPTSDALQQAGFRVLRYDLFGRGWSERPDVCYDSGLFDRQLGELLSALRIERASLVGLSMGACIAATYSAEHSSAVIKLVLIDPAGAAAVRLPAWLDVVEWPIVGNLVVGIIAESAASRATGSRAVGKGIPTGLRHAAQQQMRIRGTRRALLSTARCGMLGDHLDAYSRVGKLGTPTLVLWGREDRIVSFAQADLLRTAMPGAQFRAIDRCGHLPHLERPQHVNSILVEFLS